MLTIKRVDPMGHESIDYAARVLYQPPDNPAQKDTPCPHWGGWVTAVECIRGRHLSFGSGVIYVMNETGATISKWDLGNVPRDFPKSD